LAAPVLVKSYPPSSLCIKTLVVKKCNSLY
jgi:hypothetical protein